jgi:hypothetical protein
MYGTVMCRSNLEDLSPSFFVSFRPLLTIVGQGNYRKLEIKLVAGRRAEAPPYVRGSSRRLGQGARQGKNLQNSLVLHGNNFNLS